MATNEGSSLHRIAKTAHSPSEIAELLDSFQKIGEIALATLDPAEVSFHLGQQIVELGVFRSLAVALVYADEGYMEITSSITRSPSGEISNGTNLVGIRYALDHPDILADVARSGRYEVIEGKKDKRFSQRFAYAHKPDKISYFIPVKKDGRVLAVLATGSVPQDREKMLARIQLMQPLLAQIGAAIDKAQIQQKLNRARALNARGELQKNAENVVRLKIAYMDAPQDFAQVVNSVSKELHQLGIAHDHCSVQIINQERNGYLSFAEQMARNPTDGLNALDKEQARENAQRFPWVIDCWRRGEIHYQANLDKAGPLGAKGSVVDAPFSQGTLALYSSEADAFDTTAISLVADFAHILSEGYQRFVDISQRHEAQQQLQRTNSELEERVQQRTQELEKEVAERRRREVQTIVLRDITRCVLELEHINDISTFFQALDRALTHLGIPYHHCTINIVRQVEPPIVQYFNTELREWRTFKKEEGARRVIALWQAKQPTYRADLEREDLYSERTAISSSYKEPIRCVIDIPFAHGTLALNSTRANAFAPPHITLLKEVAEVVAIGIQRLESIRQLETHNIQLEQEIDERLRLERQKEAQEQVFHAIVDTAVDGIITIDEKGSIESFNKAAEHIFGYSANQVLGENISMLMPEPEANQHAAYIKNYLRTGVAKIIGSGRELQGRRRDGSLFSMELNISEFSIGDQRHFAGIVRNIDERKQLEKQLSQGQKMEAIGQLAGGVAHDINNILTAVNAYCQFLSLAIDEDNDAYADIIGIEQATERAAALTRQLLAFSRRQVLTPRVVNLNSVVEDMNKMLMRLIPEHIALHWRPTSTHNFVRVDVAQIEQVLLNLIINASDAMPQGGNLYIDIENSLDTDGIKQVVLSVRDTGIGIDRATLDHIFEPFFSTKAAGKGTGLGLATVFGVVKQSGGDIRVESSVGEGTTFYVHLPAVEDGEATDARPAVGGDDVRGDEHILLVEDQHELLGVTARILRKRGFQVSEASDGKQALAIAAETGNHIDLVLTDVVMPYMNGGQLAAELRKIRPDIKVCFMSGYADDELTHRDIQRAPDHFIAKPFSPQLLLINLRQILDQKKG